MVRPARFELATPWFEAKCSYPLSYGRAYWHYIRYNILMVSVNGAVSAVPAGRYIVAVSGGVDSMALLHGLSLRPDITSIVAHVNHGIRADAHLDSRNIESFCKSHNILYESTGLQLGEHASEQLAREARYSFLQKCLNKYGADAILTAHHQDDLLETAVINMIRGTGWRGVAPFVGTANIMRPLINVSKSDIVAYAAKHAIDWREDSTNTNQTYLRNYVRLTIMPLLDVQNPQWRSKIMRLIRNQQTLRRTIEAELDTLLSVFVANQTTSPQSERYIWCMLPAKEAYELFQALCRKTCGNSVLREQALAALLFIKVAKAGRHMTLGNGWRLRVTRDRFIVEPRSSVVS